MVGIKQIIGDYKKQAQDFHKVKMTTRLSYVLFVNKTQKNKMAPKIENRGIILCGHVEI